MPRLDPVPDDRPLQRLLAALPAPVSRAYRWLCQPALIWLRVPLALVLMLGGCLGFLPVLGFWMVPLGLLLLAEDLPFLRRPVLRFLGAVQSWWDRYRLKRRQPDGRG
jgi:uncharacterized membrane protein